MALIGCVIEIVGTYLAGQNQPDRRTLDAVALALLAVGAAALVFRRQYPGWLPYLLGNEPAPTATALFGIAVAVTRGRAIPHISDFSKLPGIYEMPCFGTALADPRHTMGSGVRENGVYGCSGKLCSHYFELAQTEFREASLSKMGEAVVE